MRTENLGRLKDITIPDTADDYLVYKYYLADLFSSFKQYANGKLLDIGCGNKPFKYILTPYVSGYIGCDIVQSSENSVDILCDANKIPLDGSSFDTVISTQTIEHVQDHQGLVNEAFRLLKSGGHFIVSGPMYWPLHEQPYDFFRFTKYGFQYILEKAGFKVIEIKSNGGKWALCGQVIIHTFYPDIENATTFKGRVLKILLKILGGKRAINRFFSRMDDRSKVLDNTMNYVIIAKKDDYGS